MYWACAKRPYFQFRYKIWRHNRVPRPLFPIRRKHFCDFAINKGCIAYFFYCTCAKRPYFRSRFEYVFTWLIHRKSKKSAIFSLPVYLAYWPRNRATCWAIHVYHFHQVWSWYDYPSPSYSVVGTDTLRDLVTLTFDLLALDSDQTWLVTCATPPPSLNILRRSWLMNMMSAIGGHHNNAFGATAHAPYYVTYA